MSIKSPAAALFLLVVSAIVAVSQGKTDRYVRDEVLMKIDTSTAARSTEALASGGASVVEHFAEIGWRRVKIPAGLSVDEAVDKYRKINGVIAVQPNYYYRLL